MTKRNLFFIDDKSDETEDSTSTFNAEYARSNRSTCHGCNTKIEKDLVRLSRIVSSTYNSIPTDQWYHIDCFKEHKDELHFHGVAETFVVCFSNFYFCLIVLFRFSGFNDLNKEDQTELKKKFGSITVNRKRKGDKILSSTNNNDDAPKAKQPKTEENNSSTPEQDETYQKKVWD